MDHNGFKSILAVLFNMKRNSCIDQFLAKRIFALFDDDGSGKVAFDEFIGYVLILILFLVLTTATPCMLNLNSGISSIFHARLEDRARTFHSILDIDGGGTISPDEIRTILIARSKKASNSPEAKARLEMKVKNIMRLLDDDGDGDITADGTSVFSSIVRSHLD